MGITETPDFNLLTNGVHKPSSEEGRDSRFKSKLSAAVHRLQKNRQRATNRWAKHCYKNSLSKASLKLQTLIILTPELPPIKENTPLQTESVPNTHEEWTKVPYRKDKTKMIQKPTETTTPP